MLTNIKHRLYRDLKNIILHFYSFFKTLALELINAILNQLNACNLENNHSLKICDNVHSLFLSNAKNFIENSKYVKFIKWKIKIWINQQ